MLVGDGFISNMMCTDGMKDFESERVDVPRLR